MICPYCNNEMEKGHIQSRDGLGWSPKKILVAALSGTLAEQELGRTVIAFRCKACKKIVIDFTDIKE